MIPKILKEFVKRLIRPFWGRQPLPLRIAAHKLIAEMRLARAVRRSAKQFESLKGKKNLRLHLGCGDELKPGWINVDLSARDSRSLVNGANEIIFVNCDLRLGSLPLDDNSCEIIYSSHFFEHLEYLQGLALMRDCYRILKPGGLFRISLPTFKELFRAYLANDEEYVRLIDLRQVLPEIEPGTETFVDHVNYGVYQYGEHKCIYDEAKICLLLEKIGFSSVCVSSFRPDIDPDNELRRRFSFYVEGIK